MKPVTMSEPQQRPSETRILLNTASRYGATVAQALVAFVLTPFLINALGTTMYGLQSLSSQILQFVALAGTAIAFSYERFAAEKHAQEDIDGMNRMLSAGLILSLASAALYTVCMLLVVVFAEKLFELDAAIVPAARAVLLLMGAGSVIQLVYGPWTAPIFIKERFYLKSIAGILSSATSLLAVWLAFKFMPASIVIWIAISVVARLAGDLFLVLPRARRALPQAKPRLFPLPSRDDFARLSSFSAWSFAAALGHLLYVATDALLITNLDALGVEHITFYNVAQRWSPQFKMLVSAFIGTVAPAMTLFAARREYAALDRTFVRGTRYGLAIALFPCMLMMLYAPWFFQYWLGDAFVDICSPILRLVLAGLLLSVPSIVGFQILVACTHIGAAVTIYLIGGILNIVLSIWLVNTWGLGLMGIALGTTVTLFFARSLVMPILVKRLLGGSAWPLIFAGCCRPVAGALPTLVAGLAACHFFPPQSLGALLLHFAAGGVVYFAGSWWITLSAEDRGKALIMARHIRTRIRRR